MSIIDTAAIFDPDFYLSQLPQGTRPADPLEHYRSGGCRRGLSPSPYFDVGWYTVTNADLADFDGDILEHYTTVGAARLADPHPSFRAGWYKARYMQSSPAGEDALTHYLRTGWQTGCKPSPLFWSDWYAKTHFGDQAGRIDPFVHFILGGWRTADPNPLFRVSHYKSVGTGPFDPDPLSHYLHVGWKRGYSTHPLFDPAHVLAEAGLKLSEITLSPLELLLEGEIAVDPYPLFSSAHYLGRLAAAGVTLTDDRPAIVTYLARGPRDVIDPHPFFSKAHYYRHSPDVLVHGIDALEHFVSSGGREGRAFHPLFSTDHYKRQVGDGFTGNPLLHYLQTGSKAGLHCRAPEQPDQIIRRLPGARRVLDLPRDRLVPGAEAVVDPQNAPRVGAFLHIFYPELAPDMLQAVNAIPAPCTVFISTDSLVKLQDIRRSCQDLLIHPFEIRVLPNRGRDIAPMLVGFADRLREVDYGLHLHSKRSRHYSSEFEAWRRYLIDGTVGSPDLVRNILSLLARDDIGAVMPEHYHPIRDLIQWGGNFGKVEAILSLMGEEAHRESVLDFPSGSMFWFKTRALAPLLDLNLTFDHFDSEAGQVDGTLAHAIERVFMNIVTLAGFDYAVIRPVQGRAVATDLGRFIGNRFFITNRDKGPLRLSYPETTRFLTRPSEVEKPRINLLVPTIDTGKAYAGVATALDVFAALRDALGDSVDARMLPTDMTPGNQFAPPAGYQMGSPTDADRPDVDRIEDAARRFSGILQIRRNDIFVATAWWTAMNAFDIGQQQARFFGADRLPIVYLIQDAETGFYPWSTKYAMADATYRKPDLTIPVFNTRLLFDDFRERGYYEHGHVLNPGINTAFSAAIRRDCPKERIVLLYARPHAERNCLPFLDALIAEAVANDPALWDGWRFIAIGEDFGPGTLKCGRIEVMGRLSIKDYAALSSRAALGVSLMVSPHPSYPPLEMAEAGMHVLTNSYGAKDLSALHGNISSFRDFDLGPVAGQLAGMARDWQAAPQAGWSGKARVDWFFGGGSNLGAMADDVADRIRGILAAR